jgi:hypothetical protein
VFVLDVIEFEELFVDGKEIVELEGRGVYIHLIS